MRILFLSCLFSSLAFGAVPQKHVADYIKTIERKYDLPANLLFAVVKQESDFQNNARLDDSHGLGQIAELTGRGFCGLGLKRLYAYRDNLNCAGSYLRYQLDRYDDDIYLAVAAYNAGTPYVCNGKVFIQNLGKTKNILRNASGDAISCIEKGVVANIKYVRNVLSFRRIENQNKKQV